MSRPLVGGIKAPEEADEVDFDGMRKHVAILRACPEAETIFNELDTFISQINYVGENAVDGFSRITPSLEACIKSRWQSGVDALAQVGCLTFGFGDVSQRHQTLLSQIVESYIMAGVYRTVYPWIQAQNNALASSMLEILKALKHHTQSDFGVRPEFQSPVTAAIKELSGKREFEVLF